MPEKFITNSFIGFSSLKWVGNSIFAIPLWANMLLRISPENEEIHIVKNYDEERGENKEIAVCCAWTKNRKLYCVNNLSKCIDVFDENGKSEGFFHIEIADDFDKQMEERILSNNQPLFEESGFFSIRAYTKYALIFSIWNKSDGLRDKNKNSIGKKVFKSLK